MVTIIYVLLRYTIFVLSLYGIVVVSALWFLDWVRRR